LGLKFRVARWHINKPKILIWVHFGGTCNGWWWLILWAFGLFYGHMVDFVAIWYILWSFGISFPRFGMLHHEKSGNPWLNCRMHSPNRFYCSELKPLLNVVSRKKCSS
jgi:hypothetical protein